jgi:hypothetical protein
MITVYLALYGPKGLVIFDHPYNADYDRLMPGRITSHGGAQIIRSGARLSLVIGIL